MESSTTSYSSRTIAQSVDGETRVSRSVIQSSGGQTMESSYESSAGIRGKNLSIKEDGEHLISEQQISRTLNTSANQTTSDKSNSVAVTGGKPFFTKTITSRSVERKCRITQFFSLILRVSLTIFTQSTFYTFFSVPSNKNIIQQVSIFGLT